MKNITSAFFAYSCYPVLFSAAFHYFFPCIPSLRLLPHFLLIVSVAWVDSDVMFWGTVILTQFLVIISPSMQMLGLYLKLGHDRFHMYTSQ